MFFLSGFSLFFLCFKVRACLIMSNYLSVSSIPTTFIFLLEAQQALAADKKLRIQCGGLPYCEERDGGNGG